MLLQFDNLTTLQSVILNYGLVGAILLGIIWGLSGKKFKWEQRVKPYILWVGIALILGSSLYGILHKFYAF